MITKEKGDARKREFTGPRFYKWQNWHASWATQPPVLALHHSAPHTTTQFVTSFSHRNNLRKEGAAPGPFYRPGDNHSSWGWGEGQIKQLLWASQVTLVVKNLPANAGEIPGLGRYRGGGGNGNPLQFSCLENPMDRGPWRAIVRGVAIS